MYASRLPIIELAHIKQALIHWVQTTVSVTNGVGVHARGGLLDSEGTELEKLRNNPS